VQSCGCGLAALGSPDLIFQIWWLSPFTSTTFHLTREERAGASGTGNGWRNPTRRRSG
jgi:hypothetical protein